MGRINVRINLPTYFAKEPFPNDTETQGDDPVLTAGHQRLTKTIKYEIGWGPAEKLAKVLAAVYRSIQRRTNGGGRYLEFVSQFTGIGRINSLCH